jgi:hypothetical protein
MSLEISGLGIILVSMKWHFGHSKMRFSELSDFGDALSRSIRIWHLPQRGRSIAISERIVDEDILEEDMAPSPESQKNNQA